MTFNVGNSRTFTLYAEDGEEIVTTFDLRQGIVNVLDPRDEAVDCMYRHGAQLHGHGVSIGFVVRHVPHYRQFDPETDEMVLNENERAYEDGCQKLNDKQHLVEGGSFYQQFFHHPRCDQPTQLQMLQSHSTPYIHGPYETVLEPSTTSITKKFTSAFHGTSSSGWAL